MLAKVYIFGKVFDLGFRKHQNHFHRNCESKVTGWKVRNLSGHMGFCLKPNSDPPKTFEEITSNLVWGIFNGVEIEFKWIQIPAETTSEESMNK